MFRKALMALVLTAATVFAADPVTERGNAPQKSAPAKVASVKAAPQVGLDKIPGTTWSGKEEVNNNGRLVFGFRKDSTAIMVDANSTITGDWKTEGNELVITFKNCVYRGTIQGNELVGKAKVTEGKETGLTWGFRVAMYNPYAQTEFRGNETLPGFGALKFRFAADGSAQMVDARGEERGTVVGTYTYDVDRIVIRFGDCEYVGQAQPGNVIAGTARYTNGNDQTWTFSVRP